MAWLGLANLACLDLAIDPKSQILNTCKSRQIHIISNNNTNSTTNTSSDINSTLSYILVDELVWPAGSEQLCLEQLFLTFFLESLFVSLSTIPLNYPLSISSLYCPSFYLSHSLCYPFYIIPSPLISSLTL